MKKVFLLMTFSGITVLCSAQITTVNRGSDSLNLAMTRTNNSSFGMNADTSDEEDEAKEENQRWTFIAGAGWSYITRKLYADPVINPTDNTVQIQMATRSKTNLVIGIAYIFGNEGETKTISRNFAATPDGTVIEQETGKKQQKGFTMALFMNPLLISKITESQNFFNVVDFGVGFGHTFPGGFSIFGTTEFFGVNQPRDWFINQYKDKNLTYTVGGENQKTIDLNDKNVFTTKLAITFGFKLCYEFNTVKKYAKVTAGDPAAFQGGTPTTLKTYF